MVFSSNVFLLLFLPLFFTVYFLTPHRFRNYIALFGSIFFYSWGGPVFIGAVLLSIVADYYLVQLMAKKKDSDRKRLLILSIILNVGLLAYFKYSNFFVDNLNHTLEVFGFNAVSYTKIVMPIGISFFTFQKLSYTMDVYRGTHSPLKKVTDYALYILLFPQLIAGPIVRFSEIADQLGDRKSKETIDNRLLGFYRFVIGLAKKVLIANTMAYYATPIFKMGGDELTTSLAWLGALTFAFQIYFDFAGYSDMAIGLGRMMGFTFPENFNSPYISQNITEFWRRWHITLGRWMRDYLYIPLGGNRVPTWRMYTNLWIVFLISGFWHGAQWTFILWGAFHGFFLIADRLFLLKFTKMIGKWPSILLTFIITLFGWVIFNSPNIEYAFMFMQKMVVFDSASLNQVFANDLWYLLLVAAALSLITAFSFGLKLEQFIFFSKSYSLKGTAVMYCITVILLIICSSFINASDFNPFIYWRF